MLMPFIGTNHVIDLIITVFWMVFSPAAPELCYAKEYFGTILLHKFIIAGDIPVLVNGIGDTRVDMQFNAAIQNGDQFVALGVNHRLWCGLLTIQCTFPGILGALVTVTSGLCSCRWQQMIAIEQQIAGNRGMDVGEVRQHKDFGIMKDMATIAEACQSLGGNAVTTIMGRGTDAQLIEVVTDSQLCLIIPFDNNV